MALKQQGVEDKPCES